MTLLFTSFIAGILTILAPCVLPLLPVIVGGSLEAGSKKRAITIAISLAVTVVLFTLLLKASTLLIDIPPQFWNYVSGLILLFLGLTMIFPSLWYRIPFVNKLKDVSDKKMGEGIMKKSIWGDILIGASLGPVFSTCSPTYFIILATVLPASFGLGLLYMIVYAIGLALSLLGVSLLGSKILNSLALNTGDGSIFKKVIGVIIIIVSLAIMTGIDKKVQTYLVTKGYGETQIEKDLINASTKKTTEPIKTETKKIEGVKERKILGTWKEIVNPGGFVNTGGKPIKLADYIGKDIILLDVMTYSCINCIRTFPYLKKWDESYRDKGLQVIGIHTPEFAFERKLSNVETAMKKYGLTFPVVLDNDYGTWNAYENTYWPRKYIIDLQGNIVYDHIGEGDYDETELFIRELLEERNSVLKTGIKLDSMNATSVTPATNISKSNLTPETYLGSDRSQYSFSGKGDIPLNQYRLNGIWKQTDQSIISTTSTDTFESHFISPNFYIVGYGEKPVTARILLDGKPITDNESGKDVKGGKVTFGESRLYHLYKNLDDKKSHIITIIPESTGLELFALTFGE